MGESMLTENECEHHYVWSNYCGCHVCHFVLKEVDLNYHGWLVRLTRKEIKQVVGD